MKEIIESITTGEWKSTAWSAMEGYIIKTNKQEIKIGINNFQSCCENWGYLTTNDDLQDFIGAEIRGLKLTDTALNSKIMKDKLEYGFDEGGIQFVDIETDRGAMQLAVYNSHNGYYGHAIEIVSAQLKHEGGL